MDRQLTKKAIDIDLSQFPLLSGLTPVELEALRPSFRFQKFDRGDVILKKGDPSNHLLFLIEGLVEIIDFDQEGCETWIATIQPGQHFGELGLILNEPRSTDAIAAAPSYIARLPRKKALELLTHHPVAAKEMMEHLARTIKQQNAHLHMLNQPSAIDRIKELLLLKATKYANNLLVVENMPSQAQLAKMANTSRETVSRTLARLTREGIVEKDYRRLIIRYPEALQSKSND